MFHSEDVLLDVRCGLAPEDFLRRAALITAAQQDCVRCLPVENVQKGSNVHIHTRRTVA